MRFSYAFVFRHGMANRCAVSLVSRGSQSRKRGQVHFLEIEVRVRTLAAQVTCLPPLELTGTELTGTVATSFRAVAPSPVAEVPGASSIRKPRTLAR
jgi:hypothetical protein